MGDTSNRLAGTASVTTNGVTIMVAGQFKYSPSTVKRETLTGMDRVHGYKEKPSAPYISCQVRDSGGTTVADFNDMTDVTVVAELANGKTIIGTGMWTVESQEVDSEDAVFDVRWESFSVVES
ncbi:MULTISPECIES: phage tail tube protein [Yersiniaceae]|jgi:Phage tail tube protein.|uniref:Phage tail tube protein n=1 Tax=Rahnella laticis TaxID=2787622 RepID=A0ABS0E5V6_9GAMM|nr:MULTISPECIES: phage tail tube protein [Yersiniaceae]UJD90083.1 phage tail protein [Rahnella aquatilis]MBF7978644.1 phage tail tube protein [Rahnella laticis]MBF7998734.1 phage tail tube protein [Rahnella sp. LAC-M12]MBV6817790.1 phage tail tube protein [Rahnella sp. PD12R]MCC3745326.1 phage tail tube protein [Rouxiella badensis]